MSDGPPPAPPPLPAPPRSALFALSLGATWLLGPFGEAILRKRLAKGKEDPDRWREKLGEATRPRPAGPLVWVHAVSVGESLSVLPLVERLVAGGASVLVTTTTLTSARLMTERLPQGAAHQFLPIDTAPAVDAFLTHWHPDVAVVVESEFWPRLIHATHRRGIPLVLANARMSDASARRWRRMRGPIRAMLGRFTAVTAPDAGVAALLVSLGADAARITVTGSLKRGAKRLPVNTAERARLSGVIGGRPCWVAVSTHPGEEAIVAAAQKTVLEARPDALLILAPRHPERGTEVAALLAQAGLSVARRTAEAPIRRDTQVYLADTLGELGLWFELGPVAFIGGSLVPVGGHNAYEAAAHGAAILTGPQVTNFAPLYDRLRGAGGARVVTDAAALAAAVLDLFDPARRAAMVSAASDVVAQEDDATQATADMILRLVGKTA